MRSFDVAFALLAWAASPPVLAQTTTTAVSKIVGETHKLLLDAEGRVVGWGAFDDGRLGPAGGDSRLDQGFNAPVLVPLPDRATDVAAGQGTSYAMLADGTVLAWGRADAGRLGNGSVASRDVSKPFSNGTADPGSRRPPRCACPG